MVECYCFRKNIEAREPQKDLSLDNGLKWEGPGIVNGQSGIWELVIDRDNNRIVHFFFNINKK